MPLKRERAKKSAIFCSGIIERLYYRIFLNVLFWWKKEDKSKHMHIFDGRI